MTARAVGDLGLCDGLVLGPRPDPTAPVVGLTADSRAVRPGMVFAALRGATQDGARHVPAALAAGAAAVLTSLDGALRAIEALGGAPVPFLIDEDPRRRLALAVAAFHAAQPATLVAVTGTAGKTSVASFARQLWAATGAAAVNIGTVGVEGAVAAPLSHTTPDPVELHALLAALAGEGVTHAAMEASSHGLAQRRVDGCRLAAGGLTNIGRDHMDYHADRADYVAAKLRLFSTVLPEAAAAAANADDPVFPWIADLAASRGLRLIPVGHAAASGLRVLDAAPTPEGQRLRFVWEGREREASLPLVGTFQGGNALLAAALCIGSGSDPEAILGALPRLSGVRGRMERVAALRDGAQVFVDYAHKPEALDAALAALRLHTPGRLVVVFGAGGDRDAGKRPLMGAAAAARADRVIVTDDNPRSEDPAAIRAAVLAGAPGAEEIGDRAEAIAAAVAALGPGDRLLIAGKGHETGQIVGGRTLPFDDAEAARAAVVALEGRE